MCEIFICVNFYLYDSFVCLLCLYGVVISVWLECLFWEVFEEIGQCDGLMVNQFISKFYDELFECCGEVVNFVLFLCVCCLCYLMLKQEGCILVDMWVLISLFDVVVVLDGLLVNMVDVLLLCCLCGLLLEVFIK